MQVMLLMVWSSLLPAQTSDSAKVCECASMDFSPAGQLLGHEHPQGVWKLSYRYMNMQTGGPQKGSEPVDYNTVFKSYMMSPEQMKMDMHMLMAMYGFTDRFSLMLMLNYNAFDMDMKMNLNSHFHSENIDLSAVKVGESMKSSTRGLGDTKLYASYSIYNSCNSIWFFNGGISIPTGSIEKLGDEEDVMYSSSRLPYMMQMGSGTVDLMPGISYLLKMPNSSFSVQLSTIIHPYNNSLNYHLGDQIGLTVWGAYKWKTWISNSIRFEAKSIAPIVGKDMMLNQVFEPAAITANYGGTYLNGYLGLNIYFDKSILKNNRLSVEYGLPIYQRLNGLQQTTKGIAYLEWLFTF